jgi:hypothetical protein
MVRSRPLCYVLIVLFGVFSLPMLLFGGWLLSLWLKIHLTSPVYLDYPYLARGAILFALGVVALSCTLYGVCRRSFFGVVLALPVLLGLWAMIAIPNIAPYDLDEPAHFGHVVRALDEFEGAHDRFPQSEPELLEAVRAALQDKSQYRQGHQQLPYQAKCLEDASGPFLGDPGKDPAVMFYAVSADGQRIWITFTELNSSHPVGGPIQFRDFYVDSGDPRVFHREVASQ